MQLSIGLILIIDYGDVRTVTYSQEKNFLQNLICLNMYRAKAFIVGQLYRLGIRCIFFKASKWWCVLEVFFIFVGIVLFLFMSI